MFISSHSPSTPHRSVYYAVQVSDDIARRPANVVLGYLDRFYTPRLLSYGTKAAKTRKQFWIPLAHPYHSDYECYNEHSQVSEDSVATAAAVSLLFEGRLIKKFWGFIIHCKIITRVFWLDPSTIPIILAIG